MRYDPTLDGIRALAALAVVFFHSGIPGSEGGFLGVDAFFVLSGYLITRLLSESPDLGQFYIRRAKRLIPPFALMITVYLAGFPFLIPGYPHARDAALSFFYLSDYSIALYDLPTYLRHTWSLSVEEHFYLIWPFVFLAARPSHKSLFVAYVAATAWRWGCGTGHQGWIEAYHRFDTHASGLILGCAIARAKLKKFSAVPGMIGMVLACIMIRFGEDAQGLGITAAEICAAVTIGGVRPRWLGLRPIAYIGKLSYGVYLWHFLFVSICQLKGISPVLTLLVSLFGGIACAAISYHTIEAWFRNRRRMPVPLRATDAAAA